MAKTKNADTTDPPDPRRALTFSELVGNEPLREYLQRAWSRGRLPQALLLYGPEGIGKSSTAFALARTVVADGADPASHPRSLKVARDVHPDVIELSGRGSISSMIRVDHVRWLEERVRTAPLESPRKMVLIEPADRMNPGAANALLKLLEEPPPSLTLILVTPEPNRLLDTIRSRCAPLSFEPVAVDELSRWLQQRHATPADRADLLARLSEGRPGHALRMLRAGTLEGRQQIMQALAALLDHGFSAVFRAAQRIAGDGDDAAHGLMMATMLLRDAMVIKTRAGSILHQDLANQIEALAGRVSMAGLLEAAEQCERAAAEMTYFYHPGARQHFVEWVTIEVGRALNAA